MRSCFFFFAWRFNVLFMLNVPAHTHTHIYIFCNKKPLTSSDLFFLIDTEFYLTISLHIEANYQFMDVQFLHYCAFRFVLDIRFRICAGAGMLIFASLSLFFVAIENNGKSDQTMNGIWYMHSVAQFYRNCKYLHRISDVNVQIAWIRFIENQNQYWDEFFCLLLFHSHLPLTILHTMLIFERCSNDTKPLLFFFCHAVRHLYWRVVCISDQLQFRPVTKYWLMIYLSSIVWRNEPRRQSDRQTILMKEKSHPSINLTNIQHIHIYFCFPMPLKKNGEPYACGHGQSFVI